MADRITEETMDYVSILAKLSLSSKEKEKAKTDMENMLAYIDKLQELDTSQIEPMSHIFPVQNVFREDTVTEEDKAEEIVFSAPEKKEDENYFKVPKTVE